MNFKIMSVDKNGNSKLFSRKKFNQDTDSLMILADNEHKFYFENIEKAESLDDRLEKALEIIDILKYIDDECYIEVDEYICICDSGHCLYDTDYIDEHNFSIRPSLVEWAKELVSDLEFMPDNIPSFITRHIDWDGVAQELLADYDCCQLKDNSYLIWDKQ